MGSFWRSKIIAADQARRLFSSYLFGTALVAGGQATVLTGGGHPTCVGRDGVGGVWRLMRLLVRPRHGLPALVCADMNVWRTRRSYPSRQRVARFVDTWTAQRRRKLPRCLRFLNTDLPLRPRFWFDQLVTEPPPAKARLRFSPKPGTLRAVVRCAVSASTTCCLSLKAASAAHENMVHFAPRSPVLHRFPLHGFQPG